MARELLLAHVGQRVTLRMLAEAGLEYYTARNAVAEAKKTFGEDYTVTHVYHKKGESVSDNGWILERSYPVFDGSQALLFQ